MFLLQNGSSDLAIVKELRQDKLFRKLEREREREITETYLKTFKAITVASNNRVVSNEKINGLPSVKSCNERLGLQ